MCIRDRTIPCHQSLAHASALKCHLALKEDFILNNMFIRIKAILKGCYECQTARHPNLHTYVDMQNIKTQEKGELVAMDFLGPFPVSYTHLDVYKRQTGTIGLFWSQSSLC